VETVAYLNAGGRRLTPAMVTAQVRTEMLPMSGAGQKEIMSALRRARRGLGLTCQLAELLIFLVSWTAPDDWHEDGLPLCTARNLDIQEQFDLGRTRVKELLRALAEGGWIIHRDSPNGHRFARRLRGTGPVISGFGIDLSPLSRRYDEIRQMADAVQERRREGRRLHSGIMSLARRIYALCETATEAGLSADFLQPYARQARELTQLRGEDRDPAILGPIHEKLEALIEDAERRLSLSLSVENDPMGPPGRPDYTTTNPEHSAKATVNGVGSADRCIKATRSRPSVSHDPSSSPLNGFKAGPTFLLLVAPELREFCATSKPSEAEIVSAAHFMCHTLGISDHAWRQACSVLGTYETAVAIAVITAHRNAGKIRSAGGYLRAMISRHAEGTLALDRSLYGLADVIKSQGKVWH